MAAVRDVRRAPREVIERYLRVFRDGSGEAVGYLADLSSEGLMLQSERPLCLHDGEERLSLRVELAEPIDGASEIRVAVRPVWSRRAEDSIFHHTGLEFLELDEAERARLLRLMEMGRLVQ